MILNEEQEKEFRVLSEELIKWISKNCHPHCSIIIDSTSAELVEGIYCAVTNKYILD